MLSKISSSEVQSKPDEELIYQVRNENAEGESTFSCTCSVHAVNDQHLEDHEVEVEAVEEHLRKGWVNSFIFVHYHLVPFCGMRSPELVTRLSFNNILLWLLSNLFDIFLHHFIH